ncbi:hypothetical protein GLAREA_07701 [Glarea lozoyensis ATCC 20868]|uniref:Uncharacterized protein n=1 Tax=Glarea lozoyensis (strain ATCC 20868 / MF5171) TaxID=1116229 RepID=S3D1Y5_GLAL2|nr:uncharacterized protein GLAREA_07701 [Glarea lozoyensis ATCC 20868]EPE32567.1 hypothetical protein GLAREA_07701 [Glarea lozoyensis ATCC 20868]
MRTTRFQSLSFSSIRTSLSSRRSRSPSDSSMTSTRDSYSSSPISEINAIMHRQPSIVDMEEEKKTFPTGLEILEPRPIVYWGGLEERMGSL